MSVAPVSTRSGPAGPATTSPPLTGNQRRRSVVTTPELGEADRRAMARSGLPWRPERRDRVWKSPVTYLVPVLVAGYVLCAIYLWTTITPDVEIGGETFPGITATQIAKANQYALFTVVPLTLLFVLADRFRTQSFLPRLGLWIMTFGWGAFAATGFSLWANTWMGQFLARGGAEDPMVGVRAAVFVAPFVEEFAKATVLFWIAILARYRWVNRLGAITLAGLSAAAFAYVENIIYYARAYWGATHTIGASPEEALLAIFQQRGLYGFFVHPLFTIMTAIGLTVALRSRSKLVRVMAPLVGFLTAALLHMAWNGFATTFPNPPLLYLFLAIPVAVTVLTTTISQVFAQSRLLQQRLGDYVLAGWLSERDQQVISSPRKRITTLWWAMFAHPVTAVTGPIAVILGLPLLLGVWVFAWPWWVEVLVVVVVPAAAVVSLLVRSPWKATLQWLRAGTELGYLRDAMTKGLVDEAGRAREGELFGDLEAARDRGVEPAPTTRVRYPWVWLSEALEGRRTARNTPAVAPVRHPQGSAVGHSAVGHWGPPGR